MSLNGSCYSIYAEEGSIYSQSDVSGINMSTNAVSANEMDENVNATSKCQKDNNINAVSVLQRDKNVNVVEVKTSKDAPANKQVPTRNAMETENATEDLFQSDSGLGFTSNGDMDRPNLSVQHPLTSTPKKKIKEYNCTHCPYKTYHAGNFSRHMKIHKGQKIKCDQCTNSYFTRYDLKQHKTLAHSTPLMCDCCSKTFKTLSGLIGHRQKQQGEFKYICQTCNKSFRNKGHLMGHLNSHQNYKPFECVCGRKYTYKSSLSAHHRDCNQIAGASLRIICNKCPAVFKKRSALKEHIRAKHSERDYTCAKCKKMFAWRPSYNRHVKKC